MTVEHVQKLIDRYDFLESMTAIQEEKYVAWEMSMGKQGMTKKQISDLLGESTVKGIPIKTEVQNAI